MDSVVDHKISFQKALDQVGSVDMHDWVCDLKLPKPRRHGLQGQFGFGILVW